MANFTAKDVQALRQATGSGMLDAKRALEATDGDFEAARKWLREQGLASAIKRMDREASEGAVAKAITSDAAVLVELRCETDFVAKATEFVSLAEELAGLVAAKDEAAVSERDGAVDDLRQKLKENISVGRVVRIAISPDVIVGDYLHLQAGRGTNGVLVEMKGATAELAHDVAVHIAFARPLYLRREDVPEQEVVAERAVVEEISRKEGKPEAAMAKVVEGRMQGWFKERCLLEQPYARDDKVSIAQLIGKAEIVRFAQVVVA